MPDPQVQEQHEDWWNPPAIPQQDLGAALARVGNIPTQSTPDIPTIEPAPLIPKSLSEGVSNRAQNLWDEFKQSRLSGQTAAGIGATLDPMAAIPGANAGLAADELRAMYASRLGTRELPQDYDLYKYYNAENAARERFARENPETAQTMGAVMEAGLSHPSSMGHVPPAAETAVEKGRSFVEQNAPGPNQLNIFLPARARQVEIASQLEQQGVHPDSILKQTGAFRDVDGKWMREISDANSRVIPSEDFLKQYEGASGPAEAMFEHEKLYKEAPGLKRYTLDYAHQPEFLRQGQNPDYDQLFNQLVPHATDLENAGVPPDKILQATGLKRGPDGEWMARTQPTGTHVGGQRIIEAEGATPEQLRSATLHELTHAVDLAAGRAHGANSEAIYQDLSRLPPQEAVQLAEQSRALGSRKAPDLADYQDNWDGYLRHLADDLYWRNQSEARARNVETRRNMTDWERRNKHPFKTMDVPIEQQIAGEPSKFGAARSGSISGATNALLSKLKRADGGSALHNPELNQVFETMMDEHPDMVPPSGSFIPKGGLQSDDPAFGNFRAIGSAFKYNVPPRARESRNIEDRRFTHPSMPTSDFANYGGPTIGDIPIRTPPVPSSVAGIQGLPGAQSGPGLSIRNSPWATNVAQNNWDTQIVPRARGGRANRA